MTRKKTDSARVLDIRPWVRKGQSPCGPVNKALAALAPSQELVLLAPFEPRPLYAVMRNAGYGFESQRLSDGGWRIRFFPIQTSLKKPARCASECLPLARREKLVSLDARRLSAADEVAAAFQAIRKLSKGERLAIRSARKPTRWLHRLPRKDLFFDCTEQTDRSFVTVIWKD
ncbi:MAG: DUF2249 domain-containing protein [Verrucomicrobiae bacterium]|nr:DUF2249 domain-containing protein [Verrucomicrobiae bacterium]